MLVDPVRVAASSLDAPAPPDVAVIVPTFNESANVAELHRRLSEVLAGRRWELIFVDDDSPDGTSARVAEIARRDGRVRVLRRFDRRGLSSACIEGALASCAPVIVVMDADLQHDESILPAMIDPLAACEKDVMVGSRYVPGGGVGDWSATRQRISRLATRLGQGVAGARLADPMSGFFAIRREAFEAAAPRLTGVGFKILLDILASAPSPLRVGETPYNFRQRHAGESKLDNAVALEFGALLLEKTVGRYVPVKFLVFSVVGGLGLLVHLATLFVALEAAGASFLTGHLIATICAMTFNFLLNNAVTYRDRRLTGLALLRGWALFSLACSIGAAANVGVAVYAYEHLFAETAGSWILSAVSGVLIGAVWNYAVTAVYVWNRKPGG